MTITECILSNAVLCVVSEAVPGLADLAAVSAGEPDRGQVDRLDVRLDVVLPGGALHRRSRPNEFICLLTVPKGTSALTLRDNYI